MFLYRKYFISVKTFSVYLLVLLEEIPKRIHYLLNYHRDIHQMILLKSIEKSGM